MNEWTPTEDEQWFANQLNQLSPMISEEMMRLVKVSYLRGRLSGLREVEVRGMISNAHPLTSKFDI